MNTLNHTYSSNQVVPHILIVEDDLDDQLLLKIAFGKTAESLCLHFVSTVKEALDYLQQTSDHKLPDLIVLDYNLPIHNGSRLLHHLDSEERFADIEKVIVSNSCYFHGTGGRKAHSYKCFVKPHTYEGMKQLTAQLLQLCTKKNCISN